MNAYLAAAIAAAQPAAPSGAPLAPPAASSGASSSIVFVVGPCCRVAKLTPVSLAIKDALASDTARIGQVFALRLAEPIDLGGGQVIPAGIEGAGEVVHAAKSRAMGKPGELLLAARYLEWNGTRIPLRSFRFGRPQGTDNVGAAVAASFASALFVPFITGGEVRIPAGANAWAKVAEELTFPAPARAPSKDNNQEEASNGGQ